MTRTYRDTGGSPLFARVVGVIFILIGLALAAGGAWLVSLGGSWYYLLAGLGFIVSGVLLVLRRGAALWVYALVVLGTLIWALTEVGLDWWSLVPRGDVIFVLGVLLLLPWLARALTPARGGYIALAAVLAVALVVAVGSMFSQPYDIAGTFPQRVHTAAVTRPGVAPGDWGAYGSSNYGDRWSPLADITPRNVANLKVAWRFHTGDVPKASDPKETTYELTPLKIGDTLYICTPHDWAMALDPDTGKVKWKFDPKIAESKNLQHLTCRGVSYAKVASADCPERIYLPTADARLFALDAKTGRPCTSFGQGGFVNLWQGMPAYQPGFYYSTSPPVVAKGIVVIAGEATDNGQVKEPSGVIRGYDAVTGRLVWNFDPGNPASTAPISGDQRYSWTSPNSWTVSSADEALGLVYVPTGNQTPDQWGAWRSPAAEKTSSAILALDLLTGQPRWIFQTVHHDLWDMDIGAQPTLVDLRLRGGTVPALVQPTKTGNFFIVNRATGQPIFPVKERPVPDGPAPGDWLSPTQPYSSVSLMPGRVTESQMWGVTPFDQLACRIKFRSLRYEGPFTPPSTKGTLVFPGNFGVIDWGGVAVDPVRQMIFANPSYMAFVDKLIPQKVRPVNNLASPSSGSNLSQNSQEAGFNPNLGAPFAALLNPFLSPIHLPCQQPPWGYVAGMDLQTGKVVYRHKNGTVQDESPIPIPFKLGVPSLGGPIVTGSGLAFLTSTLDYYVRAYDVMSGEQLWQDRLPAGAQATPITYRSPASGRQFLLVVAGGHGSLETKQGDNIIAYALPRR